MVMIGARWHPARLVLLAALFLASGVRSSLREPAGCGKQQWFLLLNATVEPTALANRQALNVTDVVSAAATRLLQTVNGGLEGAAGAEFGDIVGSTHLVGIAPASGAASSGAVEVLVAQALLGPPTNAQQSRWRVRWRPPARRWHAQAEAQALNSSTAMTNSPLRQAWVVNAMAVTSNAAAGTPIGVASTINASYADCLPRQFSGATPIPVAEHAAFNNATSSGSAAETACVDGGGYPANSWWLLGNATVQSNSTMPEIVNSTSPWAPIYDDQMRTIATLNVLNISFGTPVKDGLDPTLHNYIDANGSATEQYAFYIDMTQCLPPVFSALAPVPPVNATAGGTIGAIVGGAVGGLAAVAAVAALLAVRRRRRAAERAKLGGGPSCTGGAKSRSGASRRASTNGSAALAGAASTPLSPGASSRPFDLEAEPSSLKCLATLSHTRHYVVDYSEIRLHKRLGEGSYGSVWLGSWRETQVAVKLFLPQQREDWVPPGAAPGAASAVSPDPSPFSQSVIGQLADALHKEAAIMAQLRHPNTVLYLGTVLDPPALVMEFCSRGSLFQLLLSQGQKLEWARRLSLAFGAAKGMLYLHSCSPPVLHRDLKMRC
eukprot:scaffold20.g7699.t1